MQLAVAGALLALCGHAAAEDVRPQTQSTMKQPPSVKAGSAGAIKGSPASKFADESPKERGAAMKAQKTQGAAATKFNQGAIKGDPRAIKGSPAVQGPPREATSR
jgi:hypothetical protein